MRIFQRNVFNCVTKAIMSGIRICKANAPTALPMDHAVEILQMESTVSYPERVQPDTPELRDIQHPRNQPPSLVHLRDLSNHPMDAMIVIVLFASLHNASVFYFYGESHVKLLLVPFFAQNHKTTRGLFLQ